MLQDWWSCVSDSSKSGSFDRMPLTADAAQSVQVARQQQTGSKHGTMLPLLSKASWAAMLV